MGGRAKQRPARPELHAAAGIHHQHMIGDAGQQAEVMRDHDDGGVELAPHLVEQLDDLRLHRDVQRRRRLIGDDQRRLEDQRHRDHDALAHAAGKLVRILVEALGRARQCRRVRASRPHAGARRPCRPLWWAWIVSVIWLPIV
jgi:hypothetical protein